MAVDTDARPDPHRAPPRRRTADVAVIGAGPAGLGAAYAAMRQGRSVVVVEAAPQIGGLARSFTKWGWRLDLGSHVLDDRDDGIGDLWDRILEPDCHRVALRRGVQVGSDCLDYPFSALDVGRRLGVRRSAQLALGAGRVLADRSRRPDASARDVVVRRYGAPLYDTLFRGYVEKYLGCDGADVDPSFAYELIGSADGGRTVSSRLRPAPSSHARAGSFRYPDDGIGAVCARLGELVRAGGADIVVGQPVRGIEAAAGGHPRLCIDGGTIECGTVVSTMGLRPIASLAACPPDVVGAASRLRSRASVLVYLLVDGDEGFPELWRYVMDHRVGVGRVANVGRWWPTHGDRPAAGRQTVLACEYWCDPGDDVWRSTDAAIAERAADELRATGLLRIAPTDAHVERLGATHVVPHIGIGDDVATVADDLRRRGIAVAGRSGGPGRGDLRGALVSGMAAAGPTSEAHPAEGADPCP